VHAEARDYALFYAGLGWQVFPVHSVVDVDQCTCGNSGCESVAKHPITKNGLKDATDDEDQIRAWWTKHPEANIGVATGADSSIWVVDVDTKENGIANFAALPGSRDLVTVEQVTGSGGRHLIFAWNADLEPRNKIDVIPGVDVRGEGGYIIVPPSRHVSGGTYAWVEDRDPGMMIPAVAPDWVLELALGERSSSVADSPPRAAALSSTILMGALPPREVRSIRSALASISPDCDHETWYRIGMALQSTNAGDQAFSLWDEWSSRATRMRGDGKHAVYPGTQELRRRWASFGRRDEEVQLSTLYYFAKDAGWIGDIEEQRNGHVVVTLQNPPALSAGTAIGWTKPEWIWGRSSPPPFPVDFAYPERLWWLREWVKALAWTFQMPADFPAVISASMAMGAIGGKYEVSVPRAQWKEPAALWFVCAMPSGMGKSLAFAPLIAPFREFEASLDEHRDRAAYEARLRVSDIVVRGAEKDMQGKARVASQDDTIREALNERLTQAMLAREIVIATRPQSDRLLISDVTSEALAEFLEEHHGRALVADPEGGVFDHALGGANRSPRLDVWLKAYSGETIDERRIGNALNPRSKGRFVKRALVSIAVATQPQALGPLFMNEMAGAKGFLARFLTVIVPPELPEEFVREGLLPQDLAGFWRSSILRLLGGTRPSEPIEVQLSEEARELFVTWGQGELDHARGGSSEDAESYLSAWNAKFRGKALRLALLFHVLAHEQPGSLQIGPETMEAVLAWLPYLRAHNDLVAIALRDDPDLLAAERVLSWLDVRELAGTVFSRGAVYKGLKGGNSAPVRRVDDLNGPLAALVDTGWLRPVGRPEPRQNGPPSARQYLAHPELRAHLAQHRAAEAELGRTLGRMGL